MNLLFIFTFVIKFFGNRGLTKYAIFQKMKNYAYTRLKSSEIFINNYKMILDLHDTFNLSITKSYEPIETDLVKKHIKKNDRILDIGANIGYYTLLFASIIGSKGHVFSFEPEPKNFKILESNVKLNNFHNTTLEKLAVSNQSGNIELYLSDEGIGQHRIHKSRFGKSSISVKMISIDDYFDNNFQKIDFIKIDVEGAEYDVLKGMKHILKNNSSIKILLEFNPINLIEHGSDPKEFLDFLETHNFLLHIISEKNNQFQPILSINELLSLDYSINIFCVRK